MSGTPVVMIDDNPQDIELVSMGFMEAGCIIDLITASDGEAGMRLVRGFVDESPLPVPRLVLLDLNLPRIRGADILRFIKGVERLKHSRVVILSTSEAESDRLECRSLGADGYLVKPHRLADYFAMIKVLCESIDDHGQAELAAPN